MKPELLAPTPHVVDVLEGRWTPTPEVGVFIEGLSADDLASPLFSTVGRELADFGSELVWSEPSRAKIRGRVSLVSSSDEWYRLRLDPSGIELESRSRVGMFRALTTLAQWLRLHFPASAWVQGLVVEDRPDFAHRGFLLDVSRNRVPTQDELKALVDRLADLKINQLQLYTEHTFAYLGHEKVWQGWSPLTAEQIRELVIYAEQRFVEWVPNQNSFGHLHRWLVHEPYRRLAESPEGIAHPFSLKPEPFSLCPTDPGSVRLLEDLFAQLLPLGRGNLFNANLDETLDLGLGRSQQLCSSKGTERVYLEFVRQVHDLAAAHGKRMMIWGDIILKCPQLIAELPEDVIVLEWGYEADHPFETDCERFAAAGRELYVCPGTSGWSTFSGRPENAWLNLSRAAHHGRAQGASGYLITDWGDHGHLQPVIIGYPGLLAGACLAWNADHADQSQDSFHWAEKLDRHVFFDAASRAGGALLDLGRAQDLTGVRALNGAPLFFTLMTPHLPVDQRRDVGLTEASVARAMEAVTEAMGRLAGAKMQCYDGLSIRHELEWVAQALATAGEVAVARVRQGEDRPLQSLDESIRRRLDRQVAELVESLPEVWGLRSRNGGLSASVERLSFIRSQLKR